MFQVAILYIPALSCISMIFCPTPLRLPEPWQSCCTQEVSSFELGSPSHTRPELLKGLLCVLRRPLQEPLPWVWIRHCAQRDSPWGPWPKWKGSGNMRAWCGGQFELGFSEDSGAHGFGLFHWLYLCPFGPFSRPRYIQPATHRQVHEATCSPELLWTWPNQLTQNTVNFCVIFFSDSVVVLSRITSADVNVVS